ncbi:PREDICTED: uncharacterized protein LOC106103676 [Papilio polytes]|uniref:uncharacterized protein LOC106103676 n=1 Tax=Papilio polytes TaxID=76194 RepID=UPI00067665DC|nr:PREDICTED: uncharacterized protein LOC106103676 [Papilio polytes]
MGYQCGWHAALGRSPSGASPAAEDSDYFTPEEPATTILSGPRAARPTKSSLDCSATVVSEILYSSYNRCVVVAFKLVWLSLVRGGSLQEGAAPAGAEAPQRWALPHHVTSLPGTPLSQWSARSSGESYSSTSSSRQLLAAPLPAEPC